MNKKINHNLIDEEDVFKDYRLPDESLTEIEETDEFIDDEFLEDDGFDEEAMQEYVSFKDQPLKGKIKGTLIITWFIASIIALFVLPSYNPLYAIMVFGQYFLVFGLIGVSQKTDKAIGIPFLLVGAACIIIPFFQIHPELLSVEINWKDVIVLLCAIAFIGSGVFVIYFPHKIYNDLKHRCTYKMNVTILKTRKSSVDSDLYYHIYSFTYGQKEYKLRSENYLKEELKELGSTLDIMINPNKPKEFIEKELKVPLLSYIIGIACILGSIPIIHYLITTATFINI